jgi:hypothetical protein
VDFYLLQRCLSIVVAVTNLCGPVMTHLRTRKSAMSPSFEELLRTSYHRARCGPLYHQVVASCISSAMFKTSNTSLSKYSDVIQELM